MKFVNSKKYSGVQLYHKANKDISYYIRYRDENNKLKRLKIGDKSKGVTEAFCNNKRNEILSKITLKEELPSITNKKRKSNATLNEISEIYFKEREHLPSYKRPYLLYPQHLKNAFGDWDIDTITVKDILDYQRKSVKQGYAPATINYNVGFIGTLLSIAIDEGLYKKQNPLSSKKIKKLKVNNERARYLTLCEIEELYEYIDDFHIKLFVKIALCTGARLGTILGIKKKDIDLDNRVVNLQDLKNSSGYRGFLTNDIIDDIKLDYKSIRANDYIIGASRKPFAMRTLQRKLKKVFDELFNEGLDTRDTKNRVVIHTLRHTFASHLAMKGTPIFTVQRLLNHKDITHTMRYAKLSPDSGREFVEALYV